MNRDNVGGRGRRAKRIASSKKQRRRMCRAVAQAAGALGISIAVPAVAGESQDRALGTALGIGSIVAALSPGPHQNARPTELEPRGSWVYDALANLAANGAIPGGPERYRGNTLLDRGEIAALIAPLLTGNAPGSNSIGLAPEQRRRVTLLAWDFRDELNLNGNASQGEVLPNELKPVDGAYLRAQLGTSRSRLHPRLLAEGDVEGAWARTFYTVSASSVNPGAFSRPFELSNLIPGPVTGAARALTYDADSLYLRGISRAAVSRVFSGWNLALGRDWIQWGPEYSGSLILSDNAGPLDMFLVSKDFNFGRLGTWRLHQFAARDPEPTAERYLLGRRIEKTLPGGLEGAVSETLLSRGHFNPLDLILPFYVVEHNDIKHDISAIQRENYLIDFQLAYRDGAHRRYYGDVLIDDITLPWKFKSEYYVPRKAGFLGGVQIPGLPAPLEKLTFEGVYTDGVTATNATYFHVNPQLAYARYGNIIGNPIGPDSRGGVVRLDLSPRSGWNLFAQGTIEQHHRHLPAPDTETALLFSGSKQFRPGYSGVVQLKPIWVQNPRTAGLTGNEVQIQTYVSATF